MFIGKNVTFMKVFICYKNKNIYFEIKIYPKKLLHDDLPLKNILSIQMTENMKVITSIGTYIRIGNMDSYNTQHSANHTHSLFDPASSKIIENLKLSHKKMCKCCWPPKSKYKLFYDLIASG